MKLRILYHRAADLVADHDGQWARGGMLVRVEPPAGAVLFQPAELAIVLPDGKRIACTGQVVQLVPGAGVAIAFTVPPELTAAVSAARAAPAGDGAAPEHGIGDEPPTPPPKVADAPSRLASANPAEKIQIALHGNKDERAAVLRDSNKLLHAYVLRNPQIQIDEVLMIAKMTTVATDFLEQVAARREWSQRPEIAIALVRNPKTATPTAVRLVDFVSPAELRQLAKDGRARPAVQQAARKKVVR